MRHELTKEERDRGRAKVNENRRRIREERRARAQEMLDAAVEKLVRELIRRGLDGSDTLLRDAIDRVLGRPAQLVAGDDERPLRIVVESPFDGSHVAAAGSQVAAGETDADAGS